MGRLAGGATQERQVIEGFPIFPAGLFAWIRESRYRPPGAGRCWQWMECSGGGKQCSAFPAGLSLPAREVGTLSVEAAENRRECRWGARFAALEQGGQWCTWSQGRGHAGGFLCGFYWRGSAARRGDNRGRGSFYALGKVCGPLDPEKNLGAKSFSHLLYKFY